MNIFRADDRYLDELSELFNEYRKFYDQPSDPEGCLRFLTERLANEESVIFAAQLEDGRMAGFTQLYLSFCSVEMKELIYLYDLFVSSVARRQGIARALMGAARQYAIERKAGRLQLETAVDNRAAQKLYESLGWKRDEVFYTYHLELPAA